MSFNKSTNFSGMTLREIEFLETETPTPYRKPFCRKPHCCRKPLCRKHLRRQKLPPKRKKGYPGNHRDDSRRRWRRPPSPPEMWWFPSFSSDSSTSSSEIELDPVTGYPTIHGSPIPSPSAFK
ncbi:hypothetical protein HanRHA438_Chr04g0178381 [Helianthus annuus]|nr:hypothetical protein HanRHA438_Chr04g0178381 [Helianthus annuus]